MKSIVDTMLIPPGGWVYRQPESGVVIRGGSWNDLLENIKVHRISNNYPIGLKFREEIADALCREMPGGGDKYCEEPSDRVPQTQRKLGVGDLKNFLRVLKKWKSQGFGFVSQDEAERRASICATAGPGGTPCPSNQPVAGCLGCQGIVGLLTDVVGNRQTAFDKMLSGCQVCGCALKAAVHVPLQAQQAGTEGMEFPAHCWKGQDAEQPSPE